MSEELERRLRMIARAPEEDFTTAESPTNAEAIEAVQWAVAEIERFRASANQWRTRPAPEIETVTVLGLKAPSETTRLGQGAAERAELCDAHFYWLLSGEQPTIARYQAARSKFNPAGWWTIGSEQFMYDDPRIEIGPCLGKEPPA